MKTTKEMIEVMQAYEQGEQLQITTKECDDWVDLVTNPVWNWEKYDFRIKPEPKEPQYRPYESVEEMIKDYKIRFESTHFSDGLIAISDEMPLIWVKRKSNGATDLITEYDKDFVILSGISTIALKTLCDFFTYLDGTPAGKLVEE